MTYKEDTTGQENTVKDKKNRTETGQKPASKISRLPKTHQDYWAARLKKRTYESGGKVIEIPTWQVRLTHLGREAWFNLDTANKVTASAKARDIYLSLVSVGWEPTLAKFKPKTEEKQEQCTVGEFLNQVKATGGLKPVTFEIYAKKFRSMVADVFKIDGGKKKFDYVNGGREKWLERINAVSLDKLTPDKVNAWKVKYLSDASKDPTKHKQAHVTVNSILRAGKSLFSDKVVQHLSIRLPKPPPFEGVKNPKLPKTKYRSEIDPSALLRDAQSELGNAEGDGAEDKKEMFKIILLSLGVGLRRDEIDTLQCKHILWKHGKIRVQTTEHTAVKSAESEGDVDVDAALLELLKKYLPEPFFGGTFVISSPVKPRPSATTYHHYRCNRLFRKTNKWLKSKGVSSARAIHTLRKEFGSIICKQAGIYAASTALRHSSIQITSDYYLDKKTTVVFPVGTLLAEKKVENLPEENKRSTADKNEQKKLLTNSKL